MYSLGFIEGIDDGFRSTCLSFAWSHFRLFGETANFFMINSFMWMFMFCVIFFCYKYGLFSFVHKIVYMVEYI
jgi:hypothetical protein